MRVLVAPQEFKGSLSASEAAAAIAAGVRRFSPEAAVELLPLSDGGPGLVDAVLTALGGERVTAACHDPLMRPISAAFGITPAGTAVIEMATASGLVLLRSEERDPLVATTFGAGALIAAALDHGCREIIVGVGGSATVDGGAGALQALGARLLDDRGGDLEPGGGSLQRLQRIDLSAIDPRLMPARLRVASDVRNVLHGPEGAATMFGPQKGASPDQVRQLDDGLRQFAVVARRDGGVDISNIPGSGAAGGLGAGLMLAGATIEPGFELVAGLCGLDARISSADIVITGEGRLDEQTPYGKTAWGVAQVARDHHKPVGVVAGHVEASFTRPDAFGAIEESRPTGMTLEQAMADAAALVGAATERLMARLSPLS